MITIGMEDEILRRLHQYFGGEDTFTLKRLNHVVSRMVAFGDYEYVKDYISTSPEAKLFLHGIDKESNSALVLAACEKYPDIIKLLLEHGTNIDYQNKHGRSSLMEAALWGRIDNVKNLLECGANRQLRDSHGRQAIEFAEPSLQNDEERYLRSGGQDQVYREVTFTANQARKVILELLKEPEETKSGRAPTYDREFRTHSFKKTNRGSIELIAPIAEFHVRNEFKTIASLQRPPNYPSIAAMSGWSHEETKVTVSGREWTDEVMGISTTVGHKLQTDKQRDRGIDGQYYASHAEKQLIAYFISRHVLIESGEDVLLRRAKPPVLLKQATILISRPSCRDCSQFIQAVNTALGLAISVLDRSEK
ncbi:DYW family of nucleic acid deaminases-domain-containing protein [Pyrenochaeta sp. MPI-SDFR-AT-0127]|nr:DYW family of nucleic acid deaminases-domain-containing protein [Pyrenochaeta sp. MPI-SDFR-AT-0127]